MRWIRVALAVACLLLSGTVVAGPASARRAQVFIHGAAGPGAGSFDSGSVNTGDTVVWTNQDPDTVHTVVGDGFASGNLNPDDSFEHTFNTPGNFNFHCSIHPSMTGTIQVTGEPVSSPPPPPPPPPAATGTTVKATATTAKPAAASATSTSQSQTTATDEFGVLAPTTTGETTTTIGQVAIKEVDKGGGGVSGIVIAALIVPLAAVLGGGGYLLYRLGGRRVATPPKR